MEQVSVTGTQPPKYPQFGLDLQNLVELDQIAPEDPAVPPIGLTRRHEDVGSGAGGALPFERSIRPPPSGVEAAAPHGAASSCLRVYQSHQTLQFGCQFRCQHTQLTAAPARPNDPAADP